MSSEAPKLSKSSLLQSGSKLERGVEDVLNLAKVPFIGPNGDTRNFEFSKEGRTYKITHTNQNNESYNRFEVTDGQDTYSIAFHGAGNFHLASRVGTLQFSTLQPGEFDETSAEKVDEKLKQFQGDFDAFISEKKAEQDKEGLPTEPRADLEAALRKI